MRRALIVAVLAVLVLALVYPLVLAVIALNSPVPSNVGTGNLALCPNTPNCVSSRDDERDEAYILPLFYVGEQFIAEALLVETLEEMPRTQVVMNHEGYVHAERHTQVMRFVDDFEFVFDDANKRIMMRGAARLGQSDGGATRRFLEDVRDAFNQKMQ